ncbi:hypothetical protein IT575_12560 [bacterium]|nr:hypothetical protein [bacterium]
MTVAQKTRWPAVSLPAGLFSLTLLALALSACSGTAPARLTAAKGQPSASPSSGPGAELLAALPGLDSFKAPDGPARGISASDQTLNGSAFESANDGVTLVDTSAVFNTAASGFGFGIWRFNADNDDVLEQLTLNLSNVSSGGTIWVGLTNYAQQRWEFYSVSEAANTVDLQSQAGVYSNGSNFRVAIIAFDDVAFTLDTLDLTVGASAFPGWQQHWGPAYPRAICMDSTASTYVVSSYEGTDGAGDGDCLGLIKYSPSGALLASKTFFLNADDSGFGTPGLTPSDMTIDGNANLYICCNLSYWPDNDGLNNNDPVVVKFDSALNLQWVLRLRRDQSEGFSAITLDGDGNLVLAGSYSVSPGGPSFTPVYARLTPAGALIDAKYISGVDGRLFHASVEPSSGDIFLSGQTANNFGSPYMACISGGILVWNYEWSNAGGEKSRGIIHDGGGGATVLCDEVPNNQFGSAEPEPVFLSIDFQGSLSNARIWTSPSARAVVDYAVLKEFEGTAHLFLPWRNTATSLVGGMVYEFPVGNLSALDGTLWQQGIGDLTDFATNGSTWSFISGSGWALDQTMVSPQAMQSGSFVDISASVTLGSIAGTLTDFGGTWSSEASYVLEDTPGSTGPADDFDLIRIIGYPAP